MANCVYCGRSAGLFRKQHSTCRERHQSALQSIPSFVNRYLSNPIPVARFSELLLAAAKQSFMSTETLKNSVSGVLIHFVNATLEHRLITLKEEQRISALLQAFEIPIEGEILEQTVKSDILRDLQEGKIPDRVQVEDPLPMELRPGELILWVFNRIQSQRNRAVDGNDIKTKPPGGLPYTGRRPHKWESSPKKLLLEMTGDLIVTNHYMHLVASDQAPRRISYRHIRRIEPYRDGLSIVSIKDKKDIEVKAGRIITLDDPWFTANLVSSLTNLSQRKHRTRADAGN